MVVLSSVVRVVSRSCTVLLLRVLSTVVHAKGTLLLLTELLRRLATGVVVLIWLRLASELAHSTGIASFEKCD